MASNQKTSDPGGCLSRTQTDAGRSLQKHCEYIASFNPRERGSDTVVDAASKCHMTTWNAPVQVDLIWSFELVGISVGGSPQQEDGGTGWDGCIAEHGVPRHKAHHVTE